ncbi:Ff.00g085940.m01.CDS01 [Fusarium sp. VM40]|nr:Ff.00g085940.m01.CDS01 [Fusarium sp. VM40]
MWPSASTSAVTAILSALTLLPTVLATAPLEGYGRESYPVPCAQACTWVMPTSLDCPEYADLSAEERAAAYPSAACMSNDTAYLTSIAWCIHSHCSEGIKMYKIETFWETLMIYQSESLRYSYPEALAQVNAKKPPKPMSPEETMLNRTISIDDESYQAQLNGVRGYKATSKNESTYSLLVFLSCVVIPIAFSLLRFLPIPESICRRFNAYVIDPPAWGKKHNVPVLGMGIVPTRGQALFILYIIAINAVATFEGYPNYKPNGVFPDRRYQLMRQIGNRAGIIAFANVPIVMLYAGRNSLLLQMTNWSYSTFLLLHRWVASICVIQVILHSLLWLRIELEAHAHAEAVKYPYWYWGIIATVVFSMFLPFSMLPIRKIMYEVFLILHICLSVIALVGSWYHIWYLYDNSSGFEIWLIIAMVFWVYERLLRIVRVSKHGVKKAYVTRIDDKYLRVDIPDVDAHGHCFVYFPTLSWRVWENHPFSVVSCSKGQLDGHSEVSSSSSQVHFETKDTLSTAEAAAASKEAGGLMSNTHQVISHSGTTRPGITLFVQNLKGFTAKLAKKADTGVGIPVLVECSYGHDDHSSFTPTSEYPNTLVIAGGVGIAGVLSALQSSLSMYAGRQGTTKLYWGIKKRGLVDAVKSLIVGENTCQDKEGNGQAASWGHIEAHVTIGARMDITQVLTKELGDVSGGTTVVVCGPNQMCDEARYICAGLARHGTKVRYIEESFSW